MRKPSATLSLIQRYPQVFTWIGIYILFVCASSAHQTLPIAFTVVNTTIIPMIVVWAFIYYHLAPKALHQHRALFFIACAIILAVVSVCATEVDLLIYSDLHDRGLLHYPPEIEAALARGESQRRFLLNKYVLLLLTTMAITTVSWLLDERKRLNRMQREQRARMELKYLRAQVNPHFLFNALNCIYSLTMLKDDNAPDSVMKLSDMLRYVTDDCRNDQVSLQKEVDYIRNYIDFQQIRLENPADITFEIEMENPNYKIPPMLFQPMVENCFKHSRIIDQPDGFIHLSLTQKNKQITFVAENSIPKSSPVSEDKERTGIGLQNVEQRLALLFRDNATFDVKETETTYRIELCIKS